MTDDTGVVRTTYTYDPFGNVTISGESSDNPFQYTGRENDGTGLYYYRARYYSPELQRFISEDPIRLLGGDVNYYVYVGNNPVNFVDPLGLWRWPDYISLNINVAIPTPWTGTLIGWSGQASLDRYGNLYWGTLGATVGKSATFVSGSLTAGWLNDCGKPSEDRLKGFLSGHSINVGGGYWGGGGITWVPGSGTATEIGFVTPQAGVSYHYSWQKWNIGFKW